MQIPNETTCYIDTTDLIGNVPTSTISWATSQPDKCDYIVITFEEMQCLKGLCSHNEDLASIMDKLSPFIEVEVYFGDEDEGEGDDD